MTNSLVVAKLLNMDRETWQNAEKVSEILNALANPVRLVMICLLLKKEMCALELLNSVGTTKGNISQHLKLLVLKNLVRKRKDGNHIYYSISDGRIKTILQCLSDCYCQENKDILS